MSTSDRNWTGNWGEKSGLSQDLKKKVQQPTTQTDISDTQSSIIEHYQIRLDVIVWRVRLPPFLISTWTSLWTVRSRHKVFLFQCKKRKQKQRSKCKNRIHVNLDKIDNTLSDYFTHWCANNCYRIDLHAHAYTHCMMSYTISAYHQLVGGHYYNVLLKPVFPIIFIQ